MFGPSRYTDRRLPPLVPQPAPSVALVPSTCSDKDIKLPPISLGNSSSTCRPGESVRFYRGPQYTDIPGLTEDTVTLPSLASLGLPKDPPEKGSEGDSSSITLSYWPETDVEDDTYTVRADDELTEHTCTITIHWTDGVVDRHALPIPSGKRLIDTQGQLKKEVESQLADSECPKNMLRKALDVPPYAMAQVPQCDREECDNSDSCRAITESGGQ
jgi:hypothetical protein